MTNKIEISRLFARNQKTAGALALASVAAMLLIYFFLIKAKEAIDNPALTTSTSTGSFSELDEMTAIVVQLAYSLSVTDVGFIITGSRASMTEDKFLLTKFTSAGEVQWMKKQGDINTAGNIWKSIVENTTSLFCKKPRDDAQFNQQPSCPRYPN